MMPRLNDAHKSVVIDKIAAYVANATQPEPQLKQCDICNREGTPVGSFPLRRPKCCKPIRVCSQGHSKSVIIWTFRDRCKECPLHCRARVAEVEYLSPKLRARRSWYPKSVERSIETDESSECSDSSASSVSSPTNDVSH